MMKIPFNKPYVTGREQAYIDEVIRSGKTGSGGIFTGKCEALIRSHTGANNVLLTHSCTAALEMAAILIGTERGDEVIMPSFTFPSTANAFLLRGAKPVFVDIRPDTLNIDETLIEAAITSKTKAIIVVHYAGVPCEMDTIMEIATRHGLYVIEDAAQAYLSSYKEKPAGTIGHLGTISFHATKNIQCGEGGALLVNQQSLLKAAETLRDKGTNRKDFLSGKIEKYTWTGLGTSAAIGELSAAYLYAQLEVAHEITSKRNALWEKYDFALKKLNQNDQISTPSIPSSVRNNGHIYYVLTKTMQQREHIQNALSNIGIESVSHYEPLHMSATGSAFSTRLLLPQSTCLPRRLLRLPLWPDLPVGIIETAATAILTCQQ